MKKIYLLLLVLFSFAEMKGQGCVMTYVYDSTSTVYNFNVNPVSNNSVFMWDFGDSTTAVTGNTIFHQFSNYGQYLVCVTEFDTILQTTVTACCLNIQFNNPALCTFLAITANGNDFDFTAVSNSLVNVVWDFGDGAVGSGAAISHTYPVPGVYYVCMTSYSFLDTCNYCAQIVVTTPPTPCTFDVVIDSMAPLVGYFTFHPTSITNQVTWDYGNGGTGTGITTMYQYSPGTYNVCATETDSIGTVICQTCSTITFTSQPNCYFSFFPGTGPLNTFFFNASFDTTLYLANWDFGDGTTISMGSNFQSHTYASGPMVYNVCMELIDLATMNVVCNYCVQIPIVGPVPCQANFTVVPFGLDAYFIDYSTTDPATTTYLWNFGDGSPLSTDRFPVHTYSSPGTYSVGFSIDNGTTCADSTFQTIVVDTAIITPVFCTSYFIFTQLSPYQLAVVNLSSGTNLSFVWQFGDGNISTAAYPIHNYTTHGTFQICLTVSDFSGCTNTYCDSLTVDSTGMIIYRSSNVGFTINVVSPTQLNTVNVEENVSLISSIYPNPSKDRIVVTSSPKSGTTIYSILSVSSQKMKEGMLSGESSEIDISGLASGIYFLEVQTRSGEKSFARFIKE
ncbi:MAG: PKD domain-containing protein [Bacteroidetes bacterium]|nr:PKD domain-containing protein [Bacteroidota bacterium]